MQPCSPSVLTVAICLALAFCPSYGLSAKSPLTKSPLTTKDKNPLFLDGSFQTYELIAVRPKEVGRPPRLCVQNSKGGFVPLCQKKGKPKTDLFPDEAATVFFNNARGRRVKGLRIVKRYTGTVLYGQQVPPTLLGGPEFSDQFLNFLSFLRGYEPRERKSLSGSSYYLTIEFPLADFVQSCVGDIIDVDVEAITKKDDYEYSTLKTDQNQNALRFLFSLFHLDATLTFASPRKYSLCSMIIALEFNGKPVSESGLVFSDKIAAPGVKDGQVTIVIGEALVYQDHPFQFTSCFPRYKSRQYGTDMDDIWNVSPKMLAEILEDGTEIPIV